MARTVLPPNNLDRMVAAFAVVLLVLIGAHGTSGRRYNGFARFQRGDQVTLRNDISLGQEPIVQLLKLQLTSPAF
jgi:hypothetical protein